MKVHTMKKRYFILVSMVFIVALSVFFSKDILNWIELYSLNRTMETDSRRDMLKIDRVMQILDLKPGHSVADIGAGTGLFTWPMARNVGPNGIVFAVDINPLVLIEIDKKAKEIGIKNVRTVKALGNDPKIPGKVDLIFSCGTIHYIDKQTEYFKNLHKYLKPEGKIAIIDLEKSHPLVGHRIKYSPEQQEIWLQEAGFVRVNSYKFLKHFYFIVYQEAKSKMTDGAR